MRQPLYLILAAFDASLRDGVIEQIAARTNLELSYSSPRVAVLTNRTSVAIPLGQRGCVVGTLFHRFGSPNIIHQLPEQDAERIVSSNGSELVDRYWGAYLSVIEWEGEVSLLRDPSGGLTSYYSRTDWGMIFGSDAAILAESGMVRPAIDWPLLARTLYANDLPMRETALEDVTELLAGTKITIGEGSVSVGDIWSPWAFVSDRGEVIADREERLRRTIQTTVTAFSTAYKNPICAVSGGLDSSIVAACLKRSVSGPILLTISTAGVDGDEAHFARQLSDGLGAELIEETYDLEHIEITRAAAGRLARPTSRTQSLSYDRIVAGVATSRECDCLFTGNGGDNVFAFSHSATAIYDRWISTRSPMGAMATLKDVCSLTGCSPMQAFRAALKMALRPSRAYIWRPEPAYLHADVIAANEAVPLSHPWLKQPEDALAGKAVHIALLLRIQRHLQASEGPMGIAVINPLMAQPVVEACLAIPSWEWCSGGINRSVARRAFSAVLPQAIAYRRSKGTPESFCTEIIDKFRREIRSVLLDGNLSTHGIIDRTALERRLSDHAPTLVTTQRLLELVEAESWSTQWVAGVKVS